MPPNTVKVDRTTKFGNPFPPKVYGQQGAVDLFQRWIRGEMSSLEMSGLSRQDRWSKKPPSLSLASVRAQMLADLPTLRGKNLACWCAGPCHADTLLELANKSAGET